MQFFNVTISQFKIDRRIVYSLGMLLLMLVPSSSFATQYALLIGVGDYAMGGEEIDLPGIDKDLKIMRNIALKMGVKADNITEKYNKNATRANVVRLLQEAAKRLTPNDELLIYFSVHGTRIPDLNGDEVDEKDEVLAFYDLNTTASADGVMLKGVISDDELAELLDEIPAQRKLLIVDACHSGTTLKALTFASSKSKDDPIRSGKSLRFSQLWDSNQNSSSFSIKSLGLSPGVRFDEINDANTLYMGAATDSEEASPGEDGSVFTRALGKAYEVSAQTTPFSPYCWFKAAQSMVRKSSGGKQNPSFSGSFITSNRGFNTNNSTMVTALEALHNCLPAGRTGLRLKKEDHVLKTEDRLQLIGNFKEKGWFYLLAVQETLNTFYWKTYNETWYTRVKPGQYILPSADDYWKVQFEKGELALMGIWTKQPPSELISDPEDIVSWLQWESVAPGEIEITFLKTRVD